ncbi:hypothetical protein VNO77_24315 [Canavalia gladiata]|uniref:Uncharacterized protein n=1 Tax=Canavalia gladiata TaxID=3824 RepID=A0AAN9L9F2_CANGL
MHHQEIPFWMKFRIRKFTKNNGRRSNPRHRNHRHISKAEPANDLTDERKGHFNNDPRAPPKSITEEALREIGRNPVEEGGQKQRILKKERILIRVDRKIESAIGLQ